MRTYLLILGMAFAFANTFSQESIVSEANEAYKKGDFTRSVELYDSLISQGYYSPEIYYNLGNSYYNKNDYGRAILNYEKALKYSPNDEDINHNIYLTKRKIDSEIIELPDFFLNRWWKAIVDIFSLGFWTLLSIVFAFGLVVLFGLYWFKNYNFKGLFPLLGSILFVLFLISVFASFKREKIVYKGDKCVLIKPDSLFSAPDKRSDLLYHLEPGEKFQLLDSLNIWYKFKLVNKETGWISKSNCEKI